MNKLFTTAFAFFCAPAAFFVLAACGVDEATAASTSHTSAALVDAPGFLEGEICDRHTNAPAFAVVTAVRDDDGLQRSAHTDPNGVVRLELPPGGYVASAFGDAIDRAWGFDIVAGMTTPIPGCVDVIDDLAIIEADVAIAIND